MLSLLLAAVVVLCVLVAFNLALTLALVRKVGRDAHPVSRAPQPVFGGPVTGSAPPALVLTDTDGAVVDTAELLGGLGLVAFVADGCTPCHEQLPALLDMVRSRALDGGRSVIVALAPDGTADDVVATFAGVAPVILDGRDATTADAFDVDGYPTYVEYSGGVVSRVRGSLTGHTPALV